MFQRMIFLHFFNQLLRYVVPESGTMSTVDFGSLFSDYGTKNLISTISFTFQEILPIVSDVLDAANIPQSGVK